MGVIEIEYELNKINVFTKSDEEPCKVNHLFRSTLLRNTHPIFNLKMNVFFPLISLFLGQWIPKFQKITCLNYWKCEKLSFFS